MAALSRPDTVVDNFFTLMPQGAAADFQHVIDLKVDTGVVELQLLRALAFSHVHHFSAPTLLD